MGAERVDYYSDEEYHQALQAESEQEMRQQDYADQEEEYYAKRAEFEQLVDDKYEGCIFCAAKDLDYNLTADDIFHYWLNPPREEVEADCDLPF